MIHALSSDPAGAPRSRSHSAAPATAVAPNPAQPFCCLLLTPDGTGFRNFVHSRFIECFAERDRLVVWHALPEAMMGSRRATLGSRTEYRRLPPYRETVTERVLRQAKVYGQLYWRRESGTDLLLRNLQHTNRLVNAVIGGAARAVGRLSGSSGSALARLDRWHERLCGRPARLRLFEDALQSIRPDIVFCAHQRASRTIPIMLAARRLGIPTATFIYSWDNLPKGRMAVHADHFLVWGEHMRTELLAYYPELSPARVHVVGTPQFEPYFDRSLIEPRSRFLARLGFDAARRVVCFSGCDVTTSPHDPVYLDDVASAIGALPTATRPQLVFRRCPADESDRYRKVLDRHPDIAVSEPLWLSAVGAGWTGVAPDVEDTALLANLVYHCDVVINFGSTMAMDFAVLDKPGIFLAYEPVPVVRDAVWTAREIYELPHFQSVHELQPVHWVRSRGDLGAVVVQALAHPGDTQAARARWIERHVRLPLDQASRRCYAALRSVAATNVAACT